jgi:UDP-glucose 4-epimerase
VRDIVGANMVVSELDLSGAPKGLDGVAFNVGTGGGTSVNRLADILEEASGSRPGREYAAERPGELRHSTVDTRRLKGRGWSCKWTLEEGLAETFQHIAKERETA